MSTPANEQVRTNTGPAIASSGLGSSDEGKEVVVRREERPPQTESPPKSKRRVGLAFQGGGFPAGALGAGVIKGLAEKGLFGPFPGANAGKRYHDDYEIVAFSGTSAGALLATLCWAHLIKCKAMPAATKEQAEQRTIDLIEVAARHATYYAFGNNFASFLIPDARVARFLTGLDAQLREFPVFDAFRQLVCAPWFHMLTRDWMRASLAAIMHPEEDPLDWFFGKTDAFVDACSPILDRLPSVPISDVFFKPDMFYKTYQSWVPGVPQLYSQIRAMSGADLLAYNLRRMLHGDPVSELQHLARQVNTNRPKLTVGSSNIFRGENKTFYDDDLLNDGLGAVVASGSLDEVNGWTIIKRGENQGVYLDGAWGSNPPLSEMIDEQHPLDEIWVVEFFPKYYGEIPNTPLQRQERRDQLWQNSLVEHEESELRELGTHVHRIAHNYPTEPKSTVVNNPAFIGEMMSYGYAAACCFADNLP